MAMHAAVKRVQHRKCALAGVLADIHARGKNFSGGVQNDQLHRAIFGNHPDAVREFAQHLLIQ